MRIRGVRERRVLPSRRRFRSAVPRLPAAAVFCSPEGIARDALHQIDQAVRQRLIAEHSSGGFHRTKPRPPRPTHFLSVRLGDEQTYARAAALQSRVAQSSPECAVYQIKPISMHITLAVCSGLHKREDLQRAIGAFEMLAPRWEQLLRRDECRTLDLTRIDHFGSRVVFAAPEQSVALSELGSFVSEARKALAANGVCVLDQPFVPHVTLAKLSAGPRKQRGRKRNQKAPDLWAAYQDVCNESLGTLRLTALELSSMTRKGEDGYYAAEAAICSPPKSPHSL